jgi:hypothetical protein
LVEGIFGNRRRRDYGADGSTHSPSFASVLALFAARTSWTNSER